MNKLRTVILLAVLLTGTVSVFAGNTVKKFKVNGNCGMCEKRIEKAAGDLEGVISADWNKETKIIKVTYDSTKVSVNKIQMAIAGAGHDTEIYRAKDEDYDKLPACCQYKRENIKKPEATTIDRSE